MKIKVNKFLENAAEIISCMVVGNIFTKSAEYAGILVDSASNPPLTFTAFGIGALGGAFGLVIAKGYISDLKASQTEDSFFQFENIEPKRPKIKK
jgi:hypothetical protein